ncbi:C-type lectin domain family 4 member G-like isoform X2 [Leptotrombidium deliense]|uniref:C-type lectin domain family 4 member G-like isoform X2 n=1 Tax=Leptotrombidium deliense TaxID=299467 RepID=A0A443QI13_9ACAR|nr:C-type lectin domain family 4 member G-like isoform X2 [Leptotrombidium deliense]
MYKARLIFIAAISLLQTFCGTECPQKWIRFNGNCYLFDLKTSTFYQNEERCKSFGGYVVSINNEDENKFVTSKLKKTSFWIGGQKVKNDTNQPWLWADGSEITSNWNVDFHDTNILNSCSMMFVSNGYTCIQAMQT